VAFAGALGVAATMAVGCGGGSGTICDVDFGSLAGTYSFTWTVHDSRFLNTCFDNYDEPQVSNPAELTDCSWTEESEEETLTVELVVEENGDIGNARITKVTGDDVDPDDVIDTGVKCELLEGTICDAPVRCSLTGNKCSASLETDPDAWQYPCNCATGSPHDPMGAACQDCRAAYEKYESESTEYCQKGRDGDYFEFTLTVRE
jgi:hypothetical protein